MGGKSKKILKILNNRPFEELYFNNTKIGNEGLKAIAEILKNRTSKLKILNLRNNNIKEIDENFLKTLEKAKK